VYSDTRSQKNLQRVAEDLNDVNKIMSKNINEILGRGEKINSKFLSLLSNSILKSLL
jgi:vesicle transport protein SEC22